MAELCACSPEQQADSCKTVQRALSVCRIATAKITFGGPGPQCARGAGLARHHLDPPTRHSTRECRAVFVGSCVEGQLLVNDKIIHEWVFADRESLRGWAEEWRKEYLAEGWVEIGPSCPWTPASTRSWSRRPLTERRLRCRPARVQISSST
jgi:hypothetical protein